MGPGLHNARLMGFLLVAQHVACGAYRCGGDGRARHRDLPARNPTRMSRWRLAPSHAAKVALLRHPSLRRDDVLLEVGCVPVGSCVRTPLAQASETVGAF